MQNLALAPRAVPQAVQNFGRGAEDDASGLAASPLGPAAGIAGAAGAGEAVAPPAAGGSRNDATLAALKTTDVVAAVLIQKASS